MLVDVLRTINDKVDVNDVHTSSEYAYQKGLLDAALAIAELR